MKHLTNSIDYVGVADETIDLFEGQYRVPEGISYNSYVIRDEKIAVIDTIDERATHAWFENLDEALQGKQPDFLVVLHMEPDHASNIERFLNKYPTAQVVGNEKTFSMIGQFFEDLDLTNRKIIVKENDILSLGKQTLSFVFAPMVHWPEVMVAYEKEGKVLFSADGFGRFGNTDEEQPWTEEARRYYFNIVGKYGIQVQALLKKVSHLDIQKIFPLHGPMLTKNLGFYLDKYNTWSSYLPEKKGVFIAYTSIYGHTQKAVLDLKKLLEEKNQTVIAMDLAREDNSLALANAFCYDRLVLATTTYDADIFPAMKDFISHLIAKNFQNRKIALIENGSWAPMAGKKIRSLLENLKGISFTENTLTIKSSLHESDFDTLKKIAQELCQ